MSQRLTKEELFHLYIERGFTIKEIYKGCGYRTPFMVQKWLRKYAIHRNEGRDRWSKRSKERLSENFFTEVRLEGFKKTSKTKKRLYKEGKIQSWNKGKHIFVGSDNPNWKGGKIEVTCSTCQKPLYKSRCSVTNDSFCSVNCRKEWLKKVCIGEGNPNWKGGFESYRGPNWFEQRRKTLRRDNYTCRKCNKPKKATGREPDVHHVFPTRLFEKEEYEEFNSLGNLITLCRSCHGRMQRRGEKLFA